MRVVERCLDVLLPSRREYRRRINEFTEALRRCRATQFPDLRKREEIAARERVQIEPQFECADTPAQRLFAWCPWCDTELFSAGARHWFSTRNLVWYLQCPLCKRRSRWIFHQNRIEECLDR